MNGNTPACREFSMSRTLCFGLLLLGLLGVCPGAAWAANAYVQFKGKGNAPYITNLKFHYALMPGPIEEVIVVIPEQTKYEKYPLSQVRQIEFLQVVGEKKMCPVYRVRLHLRMPGHWREVFLMPLRNYRASPLARHGPFLWITTGDTMKTPRNSRRFASRPPSPGSSVMSSKFSYTIFKKLIEIIILS
jgi:hypothetical protein